jgi:hypothetical protein
MQTLLEQLGLFQHGLELASFEELDHNIASANKLSVQIYLRDRGPAPEASSIQMASAHTHERERERERARERERQCVVKRKLVTDSNA